MFAGKDPRAEGYLLSSSWVPFLVNGVYLYLIFSLIPRYMKNRPAFKLDRHVIFYNIIQILLNLLCFYVTYIRLPTLNWHCSPVDYGDTPMGWQDLQRAHLYHVIKIIDLIDTIIFVLRKKSNQVTFLHVFHHILMVKTSWLGLVYWGGGQAIYIGLVNSGVHMIMYFYYLLTIWKPEQTKSMWWKKHITHLQFGQFGFFLITFGQTLFTPSCNFSKTLSAITFCGAGIMVILFGNFYYKTYYVQAKKEKS